MDMVRGRFEELVSGHVMSGEVEVGCVGIDLEAVERDDCLGRGGGGGCAGGIVSVSVKRVGVDEGAWWHIRRRRDSE